MTERSGIASLKCGNPWELPWAKKKLVDDSAGVCSGSSSPKSSSRFIIGPVIDGPQALALSGNEALPPLAVLSSL